MFGIIKFVDSNSVAVVPMNWLNFSSNEAAWPPQSQRAKIQTACKKKELPSDDWPRYHFKLLKTYETYLEARKHLKLAEETSDLSDVTSTKRTRVPKTYDSDDSSEKESTNGQTNRSQISKISPLLPLPPKTNVEVEANGTTHITQNQRINPMEASIFGENQSLHEIFIEEETCYTIQDSTENQFMLTVEDSNGIALGTSGSDNDFHNFYLKTLLEVKEQQTQIIARLDLLLSRQLQQPPANEKKSVKLPKLPMSHLEELNKFNDLVKNDEYKNGLVKLFTLLGGSSCEEAVDLMMKKLLSDRLAVQFSWTGAKGAKSFSDLKFQGIVFVALQKNPLTQLAVTQKELSAAMMKYFKNTKARVKISEARHAANKL